MENQLALDKKGKRHHEICKCLLALVYVGLGFYMLIVVANLCWIVVTPVEELHFEDTGSYYQLDSMFGPDSSDFGYNAVPQGHPIRSVKALCLFVFGISFLTNQAAYFLLLEFGRRLLNFVEDARTPFLPEVVKWVSRSGWVLIISSLLGNLVFYLGLQVLFGVPFHVQTLFQIPLTPLLIGCFLLLLADIFRQGCTLQQQADETL